ncbi:MAG: DNA ligase (NAD(+)) LigA [Bdellovibrionales bacterium GWA2_49_15]|nr:MAG: DNA ligase (NAD(+)) LigA [Bdellovibrionales bacterium GWA2_49_15]
MTRIEELERLIKRHKALYYQGRPEISDSDYDALEDELKRLDPKNYALNIVGTASFSSRKIKHNQRMLSLDKTYNLDELGEWIQDREVVITPKIDGVSCSLMYENGVLKIAKTRGDGEFGEDITEKTAWIDAIPKKLEINGEVRGELFCEMETFLQLAEEMKKVELAPPSSQRNIVAGLISRKDHIELCRYLDFIAFDFIEEKASLKHEHEKFKLLKKEGFKIPYYRVVKNNAELKDEIDEIKSMMENGDMLIDGMVVGLDNLKLHHDLGQTAHHPKYKIAFKFIGQSKKTKIKKINWHSSKNGILTPVAEVEPVELSGATVTNVTLHNYGIVKQFVIKPGDTIEIIRSGEVIPKFLSVEISSSGDIEIPERCPSCEGELVVERIRLICKNKKCPERIKQGILDFISKMGIYDISEKRLLEMIRKGLVNEIPDLYRLTKEDLLSLEKTKEKLAEKLYSNIQVTKNTTLTKLLGSLGITGIGINKSEKIVHAGLDSIEKIEAAKLDDLLKVEGLAEKSANEFLKSFREKKPIIDKLINLGFIIEKNEIKNVLGGKVFALTGELSIKRNEFEDLIRKNGGVVSSSVSKNTNYLISNEDESGSSKFEKAKKYNVAIISEQDFYEMIGKNK